MGISCSLSRADEERLLGGRIPFDLRRVCAETLWRPRDSGYGSSRREELIRTAETIEPSESGLKQRIVVTEFENFEKALATYNSAAYQAALKVLGSAAERDFRIVEGVA